MHASPTVSRAMFGLIFAFVLSAAYLLYTPMTRAANEVSGERRLAYKKLRNVGLLVWVVVPVLGLLSAKQLGILDPFTWLVMVSYMDLILNVAFGLILYRSPDALDHIGGAHTKPTSESGFDEISSFGFHSGESGD